MLQQRGGIALNDTDVAALQIGKIMLPQTGLRPRDPGLTPVVFAIRG